MQDRDYRDNYLTSVYHKLGTIAAYAKVLDVSVFVYFGKYSVVLNGMGDRDEHDPKTMTLYVKPNETGSIQHMYGVLTRNDLEEQRAEKILSANSQIWEEQPVYNEYPDDGQYQRREYRVTADETQGLNEPMYVNPGNSEYERLSNIGIGMYQAKTVTEVTNTMRKEMGQPRLRREVVDSSINLQRHDPGEFGQAKTIYSLTNELRQQVGQEKLVSSASKADLDMYNLMLHEEEELRMLKDVYCSSDSQEAAEEHTITTPEDVGEPPEKVYLSRVVNNSQTTCIPMLCDSGASRSVVGKGPAASRILSSHAVAFDSSTEGWVHEDCLNAKTEPNTNHKRKSIVVANGDVVGALSVPKLHLGVKGRVREGDKWSQNEQIVFITAQDAAVSERISTTVWSCGHFLKENQQWTMITKGNEQYMVYGEIDMKFKGIGGHPPIRVDFREADGSQYLDTYSMITDMPAVKPKQATPVVAVKTSRLSESVQKLNLNMMSVSNAQEGKSDASADTQDFTEYEDDVALNTILEEDFDNGEIEECNHQITQHTCNTVEESLEEVRKIMEDENTTTEERILAIAKFEDKVQKLIEMKNYYTAKRAEIIQDYNITTRSKGKQQAEASQNTNEGTYSEYDKTYKAEREKKKRVTFDTKILVDPEIEEEHEKRRKLIKAQKPLSQPRQVTKEHKGNKNTQQGDKTETAAKNKTNETKDEVYELFKDTKYKTTTPQKVDIYHDEQFQGENEIENVSDFTLATFLMENKVKI
jgi:hypothetical protein